MSYWEYLGFIKGSKYRESVFRQLMDGIKTPKELSEKTGIRTNHVSRTLKELELKDLIECKTPGLRKGRIYSLTSKGIMVSSKLNSEYNAP